MKLGIGLLCISLMAIPAVAQAPARAPGQRGGARGARVTPGGTGPIRVALITKGHPFDRENFFAFFDSLGDTITWTHVEQPAAQLLWKPENAKDYDVFVYYDAMGRTRHEGPNGQVTFDAPSPQAKKDFEALLKQGKGMVFFHHSLAAWSHTWPEYSEVIGGVCDWSNPIVARGKDFPNSGAQAGTNEKITLLDPKHPLVAGLQDGFSITDETYLCPYYEDSVKPLLRTDFQAIDKNFPRRYEGGWRHPAGSSLTGWYKTAENSPIVYIQHGHDNTAWSNPNFKILMTNAIKWAASKEAMDWAKKNPTTIFKK